MRFIPTKFHAPLDYIVGAALIAAPSALPTRAAGVCVRRALGHGRLAVRLRPQTRLTRTYPTQP